MGSLTRLAIRPGIKCNSVHEVACSLTTFCEESDVITPAIDVVHAAHTGRGGCPFVPYYTQVKDRGEVCCLPFVFDVFLHMCNVMVSPFCTNIGVAMGMKQGNQLNMPLETCCSIGLMLILISSKSVAVKYPANPCTTADFCARNEIVAYLSFQEFARAFWGGSCSLPWRN